MQKRRRLRALALLSALVLLLAGGLLRFLQIRQRQYTLDRQLIAALMKHNTGQALALVNAGADPNTPFRPPPQPSLRSLWHYLRYGPPPPETENPSAFSLASGAILIHEDSLAWSIRQDSPQLIQGMIRHGAKIDTKNAKGLTPLHYAVWYNYDETVRVLLEHGADANARTLEGESPLLYIHNASALTVRLLVEHGANINARDNAGNTALLEAMPCYDPDVVQTLLDHGADVNVQNKNGETPLTRGGASMPKVVRMLIDHGADVNARDKDGDTPLIIAAVNSATVASVKLLIDHGANVNARDNDGNTPVMYITDSAYGIVHLLVEHGAILNTKNKDGATPLTSALESATVPLHLIRFLLTHGADPNQHATGEPSALQLAHAGNRPDLVALLRRSGAKN